MARGNPIGPARDFTVRPERRAVARKRLADGWTFLRRTRIPFPSYRWWIVVGMICLALASITGCSGSNAPDPVYTINGGVLVDAVSWCFSRGGVEYFTVFENKADVLVCADGAVFNAGVWTT